MSHVWPDCHLFERINQHIFFDEEPSPHLSPSSGELFSSKLFRSRHVSMQPEAGVVTQNKNLHYMYLTTHFNI